MSSKSIFPATIDIDFLQARANTIFYGIKKQGNNYHVIYESDKFEIVSDLIDSYSVDYLDVAVPEKVSQVVALRKEKIKSFSFGGMTIELDHITETRITGVVLYLMRNENVLEINWDVGAGNFITLSRETILALGDAAASYVQGCFSHSKDLIEDIQAVTNLTELEEIDIESGWPE